MPPAKRPLKTWINPARVPLPDYLGPKLNLLFVGINPGLISAAAGHYYANPRNSFWRLLHEAGLTPVQLRPDEDHRMPQFGYGLTDIVKRSSRGAGNLKAREFVANRQRLLEIIQRYKPRAICFNSKTAFEGFFGKGVLRSFGPQTLTLANAPVFVLPSTSPANAAVPLVVKKKYFRELKRWLEKSELCKENYRYHSKKNNAH
jgi:double-stranded uracil-DNA glycosylase